MADGGIDFDFGDTRLIALSRQVHFPWVLSNAWHLPLDDNEDPNGRLLGCAGPYLIRTVNGCRVGFFGLAGTYVHKEYCRILHPQLTAHRDWPSNCEKLPPCYIESPAKTAQRVAYHLRVRESCDVVIALTHMRLAEDMEVAEATRTGPSRVDLLLGGHDHEVVRRFGGDTDTDPATIEQGCNNEDVTADGLIRDTQGDIRIVKSGTDWRGLSLVRMMIQKDEKGRVSVSAVGGEWTNL